MKCEHYFNNVDPILYTSYQNTTHHLSKMSTSSHVIPLVVIDFGLLILVIMAALQMKDIEHTQTGIVPFKVCVPCEALYVNPAFKNLSSFTVTGPEGKETCCLKTEHDVGKLVELVRHSHFNGNIEIIIIMIINIIINIIMKILQILILILNNILLLLLLIIIHVIQCNNKKNKK